MFAQKTESNTKAAGLFMGDLQQNSLQQFRDRTWMILGWATIPFLFPFSINNFLQGRHLMGTLTMLILIIQAANSYSIHRANKQLVPFWLYFVLLLPSMLYCIFEIGEKALFWCYPALFIIGFVAERQNARVMTILTLLALSPFAFFTLGTELAIRFVVTLCLTCFFIDLFVGFLNTIQVRLSALAIRDPLTNALNRRQLDSYLQDAIEETKRGFGPASVVLLDIDHFKSINDTFGHKAGDKVLIDLVETLHRRQRRLDHVFRVGGEEFLILLRHTELKDAITSAESLRKYIEDNSLVEGQSITVSFGIAEYKPDESFVQWLARADTYLYEAKNLGRNRVQPAFV